MNVLGIRLARAVFVLLAACLASSHDGRGACPDFQASAYYPAGTGPAPVGYGVHGLAVGDFNEDGNVDIVVTDDYTNQFSVLLGDGTGGFAAPASFPTGTRPQSIVVADFNRDGHLDVAIANWYSNNISIHFGDGHGSFGAANYLPVSQHPTSLVAADFNGDGVPDLAVTNSDVYVSVLIGDGLGGFAPQVKVAVAGAMIRILAGDFTGDSKTDLVVLSYGSPTSWVYLMTGDGSGGFTTTGGFSAFSCLSASDMTVADFDGNGTLDIVVSHPNSTNPDPPDSIGLYLGGGDGTFSFVGQYLLPTGTGMAVSVTHANLNGDGLPDILVGSAGHMTSFLGQVSGGFEVGAAGVPGGGPYPYGIAAADFNGDGMVDAVLTVLGDGAGTGGVVVFLADSGPTAPTAGNTGPYCEGATITLTATTVPGAAYSWTGPNGFASTAQNPPIASATTAASGTYSVKVTVNRCTSTAGTTDVIVNPIPVAPTATVIGLACEGGILQLSASGVTGATYAWTGPNGFHSDQQFPTIPGLTLAAAGTYYVTVAVKGCTSPAGTTTVAVMPRPSTPTITAPKSVGQGSSGLVASVIFHPGSAYSWGVTNGSLTTGQGSNRITFTADPVGPVVLTVVETVIGGCDSAAATRAIQVRPAAAKFYPIPPCRLFDTRNTIGPDAASPALTAGEIRPFDITGRCSLPEGVQALAMNLTVTGPSMGGQITLYRADLPSPPVTINIALRPGVTRANNGILDLALDSSGTFKAFNDSTGEVHLILDVSGWFE